MDATVKQKGVIPHLVVKGATAAIDFYKKAFGAEEVFRMPAEDGKRLMHAELKINGMSVYLCDDFAEFCGGKERNPKALGGTGVTLHQYVPDVDVAVKKAADAGATVAMPPTDMFWGDRYAQVNDPYGHNWSFGAPVKK